MTTALPRRRRRSWFAKARERKLRPKAAGKGSGALEAKAKPSKKAKGGKKDSKIVEAPPQITASDDELRALEESSGENYSESSAKIPNEVAIPGPAPPEDNKAPGGGSSGTTIE